MTFKEKTQYLMDEVHKELYNATNKFGAFHNAHEGYAVLLEEIDELWNEVKKNQIIGERIPRIRAEAIQVAAMAIRIILDCCDKKD